MSEFERREICEGVGFNSISDARFKKGRIAAALITPLSRRTASANALLSCVLTRSCAKYPDVTALYRKLNDLYGAALYPTVYRRGDFQMISISAAGLDDRYAPEGKGISGELAELLCSILFEPKLVEGRFDPEDVEQERRQLIENIDAEYNDKRTYAINRCIEKMCKDELFSIGRYGSREDVAALDSDSIYSAWGELLEKSEIELMMLGNADPGNAFESFKNRFGSKPRKIIGETLYIDKVSEVKRIVETDEIAQSKLVMGYRCAHPKNIEDRIANTVMSAVLGATPTSKLFTNVREKQSLCYYCASSVDNEKGIMLVDSGVETQNIEKTEKAVSEQISLMKNGVITDEELSNAKLAVKNAYLASMDSLATMQSYYLGMILTGTVYTPVQAAALVDNVTKDQVISLAGQIKPDTVFSLIGN